MSDHPWITEGARVAEYKRNYSTNDSVTFTTIERLTATQIVLANGAKYRRDRLTPVGEKRDAWSGGTELKRADDPSVRDVLVRVRLDRMFSSINEVRRKTGFQDSAGKVLEALAAVEQVVADTRRAIEAQQ